MFDHCATTISLNLSYAALTDGVILNKHTRTILERIYAEYSARYDAIRAAL